MENFLKKCFPGKIVQSEKLAGDGGHRDYFRLQAENSFYVFMSSGKSDPSLKDFIQIQEVLKKADLPVPSLFHQDLKEGYLILEDLGDITLEFVLKEKRENALALYQKALRDLVKMQAQVPLPSSFPRFGKDFFMEETDIALQRLEKLVENCGGKKVSENAVLNFKKEMEEICNQLDQLTFVFCHRDFHSKNLMVKNHHPHWIDFQDAGQGPYCYDLCSLLYDSYVSFSDREKEDMIKFYFQTLPDPMKQSIGGIKEIHFLTRLQFLQRGFKACGCFAGFYNDSRRTTHLPYIQPTLKELEKESLKFQFEGLLGKGFLEYIQSLQERLNLSKLDGYSEKS
ncbi:MAG: phosphotransferase [Bdellovibrionales bacterium]|nr:phosphotransferase [Bdellovibrionales bacterium]